MKLKEFQGIKLLNKFKFKTPVCYLVDDIDNLIKASKKLNIIINSYKMILKAQIIGSRYKNELIKFSDDVNNLIRNFNSIKTKNIKNIILCENIYENKLYKEYFISIILDRNDSNIIIMYSKSGGVNVEKINKIFREIIDPLLGILEFQIFNIYDKLNIRIPYYYFNSFLKKLINIYFIKSLLLLEINPFIIKNNKIIIIDNKIIIDHNVKREINKFDDKIENKFDKLNINFLKLNGDVGFISNGAGLAMATMDIIKLSNNDPSNFIDVGGNINENNLNKILRYFKYLKTKILIINIFGGIINCRLFSKTLIKNINLTDNLIIIRFKGTNHKSANKLLFDELKNINTKIILLNNLKDIFYYIKNEKFQIRA